MMFKLLICVAMAVTSYGAVHFLPYVEKPAEFADQDGCYVPELKRVVPYGEPFRPADGNPCAMYLCDTNNETQIHTCGNAVLPEGCTLVFPAADETTAENCCGIMKCDQNENLAE